MLASVSICAHVHTSYAHGPIFSHKKITAYLVGFELQYVWLTCREPHIRLHQSDDLWREKIMAWNQTAFNSELRYTDWPFLTDTIIHSLFVHGSPRHNDKFIQLGCEFWFGAILWTTQTTTIAVLHAVLVNQHRASDNKCLSLRTISKTILGTSGNSTFIVLMNSCRIYNNNEQRVHSTMIIICTRTSVC